MSKQQYETFEPVLKLSALELDTTKKGQVEPKMILGFDMPKEIEGISRDDLFGFSENFPIFKDIRIGDNVPLGEYEKFLEWRGVRPFGFYTEWIDGSVYIIDVTLLPHERTIEKNYGDDLFISSGSSPLKFNTRCVEPDFSFSIVREFIRPKFINRTNIRIPTIIGEVAYSESLDHLLDRSRQYIKDLFADIVIAVHVPKPRLVKEEPDTEIEKLTIAKGRLEAPSQVYLYIFYKNELKPEPITVPFDQEFTFQLRTDSLQRKIRKKLRAEFELQSDSIDVTILLKKDTIFAPEILDPEAPKPETSESESSESEASN